MVTSTMGSLRIQRVRDVLDLTHSSWRGKLGAKAKADSLLATITEAHSLLGGAKMGSQFTAQDLLEEIEEGKIPTAEDLEALISHKVKEDLQIDYKSGALLTKERRKEAAKVIREYVSAFANAEGGLLVLGIDESGGIPVEISGAGPGHGLGDLREWTSRVLTDLAGFLSPPPRIHVVNHSSGEVLLIAVARAYSLVPVSQNGRMAHYFRLGDQTIEAPAYLMQDLVLGRRRHPSLELQVECQLQASPKVARGRGNALNNAGWEFRLLVSTCVRNTSLVFGRNVTTGIVIYSSEAPNSLPISSALQSCIETEEIGGVAAASVRLHHLRPFPRTVADLAPFSEFTGDPLLTAVEIHCHPTIDIYAAAYIVSQDSPPEWFQLRISTHQGQREIGCSTHCCKMLAGQAPKVSIRGEATGRMPDKL